MPIGEEESIPLLWCESHLYLSEREQLLTGKHL
jgi:hypothetical protein